MSYRHADIKHLFIFIWGDDQCVAQKVEPPLFILLLFLDMSQFKSNIHNICDVKRRCMLSTMWTLKHILQSPFQPFSALSIILSELCMSIKWQPLDLHYIILYTLWWRSCRWSQCLVNTYFRRSGVLTKTVLPLCSGAALASVYSCRAFLFCAQQTVYLCIIPQSLPHTRTHTCCTICRAVLQVMQIKMLHLWNLH